MAAAAAIYAASNLNKGKNSFLDELTAKDTLAQQRQMNRLVKNFGFRWKDFGGRDRRRALRKIRMAAKADDQRISDVWDDVDDASSSSEGVAPDTLDRTTGQNASVSKPEAEICPPTPEVLAPIEIVAEKVRRCAPLLRTVNPALLFELEKYRTGVRQCREATVSTKQRVWILMNDQSSSRLALMIQMVVLFCIVTSCVAILLESLPELMHDNPTASTIFFVVETFCVTIFTAEFLARVWSTPSQLTFWSEPMNIVDILAIAPYYLYIASGVEFTFLTVLRMLRMVKLLKFASGNPSIHCVGATLIDSVDIGGFMIFMLTIMIIVFAALTYNFERGVYNAELQCDVRSGESDCSIFTSIPEAMWWAIVTVMMVGYGDIYPITIAGKFVASATCVVGILVVALPASVLAADFTAHMAAFTRQKKKKMICLEARELGVEGLKNAQGRVNQALSDYNATLSRCQIQAQTDYWSVTLQQEQFWSQFLHGGMDREESEDSWSSQSTTDEEPPTNVPRTQEKKLITFLARDLRLALERLFDKRFILMQQLEGIPKQVTPMLGYIEVLAQETNVLCS